MPYFYYYKFNVLNILAFKVTKYGILSLPYMAKHIIIVIYGNFPREYNDDQETGFISLSFSSAIY